MLEKDDFLSIPERLMMSTLEIIEEWTDSTSSALSKLGSMLWFQRSVSH
jgi:hypothetical protein